MEINQAYSNIELNKQIGELKPDSPAFVRELVYSVIENRVYLDHILQQLIPKGLKGLKKQTLTLLRMGLYQLIFMDSVPDYAAVNEIVKMAEGWFRAEMDLSMGFYADIRKKRSA